MANNYKKTYKQVEKVAKKIPPVVFLCIFFFFVVGVIVGYVTFNIITKNDTFEIIGEREITLNVGDTYTENGAKAVSFGKESNDIIIEGKVNTAKEGDYVITYTTTSSRYDGVKIYRLVHVKEI